MKLLVNIEGNDGTGKRTVAAKLKKLWEKKYDTDKISCHIIDFPAYNTSTGHIVQEFLQGDILGDPTKTDAYSASIPYTLDRLAYYHAHRDDFEQIIGDESDKLHLIICNRSYLSNYFYQAPKLRNTYETIRTWLTVQNRLEIQCTPIGNFDPTSEIVNIYLTPKELSENLEKLKSRGESLDLNEQNIDYLAKVEDFALHNGYYAINKIILFNYTMETIMPHLNPWVLYYKYNIVMIPFGKTPEEIDRCVEHTAQAISATMQEKIDKLIEIGDDIDGN